MTTALLDPAVTRAPHAQPTPGTHGRPTLDQSVSTAWAGLAAGAPVECPLCGGTMAPSAGDAGGRCLSCATTLA
jgi:hypothetical protein